MKNKLLLIVAVIVLMAVVGLALKHIVEHPIDYGTQKSDWGISKDHVIKWKSNV